MTAVLNQANQIWSYSNFQSIRRAFHELKKIKKLVPENQDKLCKLVQVNLALERRRWSPESGGGEQSVASSIPSLVRLWDCWFPRPVKTRSVLDLDDEGSKIQKLLKHFFMPKHEK